MENLVYNLLPRLESLGSLIYWVVLFVGILESLPFISLFIPSGIILLGMGFFAAEGTFHVTDLIWASTIGAVIGDSIGYYLGKRKGRKFLNGKSRFISPKYIEKADKYFKGHGGKSVFIGRFIGVLRPFVAFVAGMHRMKYSKFLLYNITSGLLWSIIYILIGFYFGNQAKGLFSAIGRLGYALIGGVLIVIVGIYTWKKYNSKIT